LLQKIVTKFLSARVSCLLCDPMLIIARATCSSCSSIHSNSTQCYQRFIWFSC